jgi:hypothetical protein
MIMLRPRFALRLLAYGDAFGVREELLGDLIEEIGRGRSQAWVCQQVIGLYGWAVIALLRNRARLTPHLVALALCLMMLAAVSISSVSSVLQAWLGVYYVTGTVSLFAHMVSARSIPNGRCSLTHSRS